MMGMSDRLAEVVLLTLFGAVIGLMLFCMVVLWSLVPTIVALIKAVVGTGYLGLPLFSLLG
jgi:hypothetical protein